MSEVEGLIIGMGFDFAQPDNYMFKPVGFTIPKLHWSDMFIANNYTFGK
jgi:hypothetical protein